MTRPRLTTWLAGLAATLLVTSLFHFAFGASQFESRVNGDLRRYLDHYEMTQVKVALHRGPLTRVVMLSGPADDFQREEMVRRLERRPGVAEARWNDRKTGVPLLVEAFALALAGFAAGATFAYLFGLRRHSLRYDYF